MFKAAGYADSLRQHSNPGSVEVHDQHSSMPVPQAGDTIDLIDCEIRS